MLQMTAAALVAIAPILPAQEATDAASVALSDADKIYGLSLLWQEANYNFAYFDRVPALQWDSLYRATLPKVLATTTTYDYYRELQRFIRTLGDGHTGVYLPEAVQQEASARESYPWLLTQEVDGRVMVRNVGATLAAQVPVHSEVTTIDGRPAAAVALERHGPWIEASTSHYRRMVALGRALNGPATDSVTITIETPAGTRRTMTLGRDRRTREDSWTPDPNVSPAPFEFRWLADGIAYVAVNTMGDTMPARLFEDSLPALRKARGLILDLRRNGGGSSSVGYRIASWLTNDSLPTSAWRTREHRAAMKAWGSYGIEQHLAYGQMNAWYDGGSHGVVAPAAGARVIVPTAILVDHATASAAEDFLVAVDKVPHMTLVGRRSTGSTGQPLMFDLPGGGRARIVTKRDTYPDGRDFVGIGVIPDIEVAQTIEDVRRGTDAQLARAIAVVRREGR
jgi:C-terminal processing protease CtpA/Prc